MIEPIKNDIVNILDLVIATNGLSAVGFRNPKAGAENVAAICKSALAEIRMLRNDNAFLRNVFKQATGNEQSNKDSLLDRWYKSLKEKENASQGWEYWVIDDKEVLLFLNKFNIPVKHKHGNWYLIESKIPFNGKLHLGADYYAVSRGTLLTIERHEDKCLSYEEIKAIASGDKVAMEKYKERMLERKVRKIWGAGKAELSERFRYLYINKVTLSEVCEFLGRKIAKDYLKWKMLNGINK